MCRAHQFFVFLFLKKKKKFGLKTIKEGENQMSKSTDAKKKATMLISSHLTKLFEKGLCIDIYKH